MTTIKLAELLIDANKLKNSAYNTITTQMSKGVNTMPPAEILDMMTAMSAVIETQHAIIEFLGETLADANHE